MYIDYCKELSFVIYLYSESVLWQNCDKFEEHCSGLVSNTYGFLELHINVQEFDFGKGYTYVVYPLFETKQCKLREVKSMHIVLPL